MDDWTEDESATFIEDAQIFVPSRNELLETIVRALDLMDRPASVLELCCGDGELGRRVLQAHPRVRYRGLDRSERMRQRAQRAVGSFGARALIEEFDLQQFAELDFRGTPDAVVSSLAVHHLDGEAKRKLFIKIFRNLAPDGRLVICDVVLPAGTSAARIAATQWDAAVTRNSVDTYGDLRGLHRFAALEWNMFKGPIGDDIDKPSTLLDQLLWMREAGFEEVDVLWHYAGHTLFLGRKR